MTTKKESRNNQLIFIDTNIYLDFYRTPGKHFQNSMIKALSQHKDKIICTNQVSMEFLKNRNKLILDLLSALKVPNWEIFRTPTFTIDPQIVDVVNESQKVISKLVEALTITTKKNTRKPQKI